MSRSSVSGSTAGSPEERIVGSIGGPPNVPPPAPLTTGASIDRPLPPIPAEPAQPPPPPPLTRRDSQGSLSHRLKPRGGIMLSTPTVHET